MHCVGVITTGFQRCARDIECICRQSQVTRSERDFSFGNDTSRAGYRLFTTEGFYRTSK